MDAMALALMLRARPELSIENTSPALSCPAETARGHAANRSSANTRKAYQSDRMLLTRWCRKKASTPASPRRTSSGWSL